jgi:adenylate kinase
MKVVLVMGPQGAGKGTIAAALAKEYGWAHISAGDLLRDEVKMGSAEGKRIDAILKKGELVDNDTVVRLVVGKLKGMKKPVVFVDGLPRDMEQARLLNESIPVDAALVFEISDELAVERISGRTICQSCQAVYGKDIPPKKKGVCDKCGGKLIVRSDDTPAALRQRIKIYHERTEPVLALYDVIRVDAAGSVDRVVSNAKAALRKKGLI